MNVYEPFNRDVQTHGGYVYATADKPSAVRANRRFTETILGAADYRGRRVVDVGCGDGSYTMALATRSGAAAVLGIDPAERAIERASARSGGIANLRFACALSSDLLARGERFDIAVYRGVIHHVGDPAAEIANALRLADRVFFLEPNGANPILKVLERVSPYHREHHERSFVMGTYLRWIESAGGRPLRAFHFGLVPMFCPAWLAAAAGACEPVVERIPGLRVLLCGQLGILAAGSGA